MRTLMRLKRLFYTVPLRLRSLFRRERVEQELDEEVRYHLERKIEDLVARGMSPQEARHAALRAFGGVEQSKELSRDARRVNVVLDLVQDLRYAARMMRRNPGFTAVAALSLAIGIGANTAVFSLIDPLFLERLPVPDPAKLVT